MNTKFRQRLLASTLFVGAAAFATPAFAQAQDSDAQPIGPQETAEAPAEGAEGEIVITGTLIRNPNLEASSPVTVVDDTELELRNTGNAEEVLRSLPGVVAGLGAGTNNGNPGFSTVDLRGLGAQRNLVLIDGNRIVPANQLGVVDLNNIPVALLDRLDVLTGGASTTYGADAVSGVVNFITRRDFEGVDLWTGYRITERGDGPTFRADLTLGANFADGRGNAVISLGYQKADPIYQGRRDVSVFGISSTSGVASGSSPTSVPVTISISGARQQLNAAGTALGPEYFGFNFNPFNIFQTPYERKNVYAAAHYDVADNIEVYARSMFSTNQVATIIAPSGIFGEPLTVPGANPFLPAGVRDQLCTAAGIALGAPCNTNPAIPMSAVFRRLVELGPRISDYETTMYDSRVGVRFGITESVELDVSGSYGESELVQIQSGYVLKSRVQQALNATNATTCTVTTNNCVPLNLFGPQGSITPEQVAFLAGKSGITIDNALTQLRAILSGDFGSSMPWAAEPIGFAVGAEYRKYDYSRDPDAFAQSPGELGGAGGATLPFSGGFDVKEGFAELIAPIVADRPFFNELTLEAGVRFSQYNLDAPNTAGFSTTTWKVGTTWEPFDAVRFRGNYQRAVRAPNINELFRPVVTTLTNLNDEPCTGTKPVGNANLTLACLNQGAPVGSIGKIPVPAAGQANNTGGGNLNLQPEKADTFTVGVVIAPDDFVSGLTISVDYYNIKVKDAITQPAPGDVIRNCFGTNPSAITAAQANSLACTSIRRSPSDGSLSGSPGNTPGLPTPLTNLGYLATDGIDVTLNFNREFGDIGFNMNFAGNWTNKLEFRSQPGSVLRDCVGYYSVNCGPPVGNGFGGGSIQPEYSWQHRTTLSMGGASLSLLWRHLSAVEYEGQADNFLERGFTATDRNLFNGTITGPSPLAGQQVNFNRIPSYDYFDLSARFEVGESFQFVVGVQNLFDKDPPVVGSAAGSTSANSGNTFPSVYDVLGRAFNASARIRF